MTASSPSPPRYEPLREQKFVTDREPAGRDDEYSVTSSILKYSFQYQGSVSGQVLRGICTHVLAFTVILSTVLGVTSIFILLRSHVLAAESARFLAPPILQSPPQPIDSSPVRLDFGAGLEPMPQDFPCGQTPAEAQAASCVFDVMTASWIPPKCFDEEITAEFGEHGPWEFYTTTSDFHMNETVRWPSPEQLILVPDEKIMSQERVVWGTRRYHLTHCIFLLRRLHRALDGGTKLASDIWLYHHSEHCGDMIEKSLHGGGGIPLEEVMTLTVIGFPDC